jgi:hypothetical protein
VAEGVIFEGDDFSRSGARLGAASVVARSSVADFLLRHRLVRSERQARWLAVLLAFVAFAGVIAAAGWAADRLRVAAPTDYASMSPAERQALPLRERLYLEQVERERAAARDREARERLYGNPAAE